MDLKTQLEYQNNFILGNKNLKEVELGPIDYVFPYVNPNDIVWKKQYQYITGKAYKDEERFRDFSLLKYIFRSIEKYAPWINKIHMLVAYKSQVPKWINQDKVNIIEHKDFIPDIYRPTFNSNTIEAFLCNLDISSNRFLYGNDDLIFLNNCQPNDFYDKYGRAKVAYSGRYKKNIPQGDFLNTCVNCFNLIINKYGDKNIIRDINPSTGNKALWIKQWHGAAVPLILDDVKNCYKDNEEEILDSITIFRNVDKNYNQYINSYYELVHEHAIRVDKNYIGAYASFEDNNIIDVATSSASKMCCINDTGKLNQAMMIKVYNILDNKFPNKSKYEN